MIMYRQWMVFMSLVIDLIGQLNCHVIRILSSYQSLVQCSKMVTICSNC